MKNEWNTDIKKAPYETLLEVTNDHMTRPVLAYRGYVHNGVVSKMNTLFTLEKDPDPFMPVARGSMVCPTKWRLPNDTN